MISRYRLLSGSAKHPPSIQRYLLFYSQSIDTRIDLVAMSTSANVSPDEVEKRSQHRRLLDLPQEILDQIWTSVSLDRRIRFKTARTHPMFLAFRGQSKAIKQALLHTATVVIERPEEMSNLLCNCPDLLLIRSIAIESKSLPYEGLGSYPWTLVHDLLLSLPSPGSLTLGFPDYGVVVGRMLGPDTEAESRAQFEARPPSSDMLNSPSMLTQDRLNAALGRWLRQKVSLDKNQRQSELVPRLVHNDSLGRPLQSRSRRSRDYQLDWIRDLLGGRAFRGSTRKPPRVCLTFRIQAYVRLGSDHRHLYSFTSQDRTGDKHLAFGHYDHQTQLLSLKLDDEITEEVQQIPFDYPPSTNKDGYHGTLCDDSLGLFSRHHHRLATLLQPEPLSPDDRLSMWSAQSNEPYWLDQDPDHAALMLWVATRRDEDPSPVEVRDFFSTLARGKTPVLDLRSVGDAKILLKSVLDCRTVTEEEEEERFGTFWRSMSSSSDLDRWADEPFELASRMVLAVLGEVGEDGWCRVFQALFPARRGVKRKREMAE